MVLAGGAVANCASGHGITGPACLVVRPEHLKILDGGAAAGLPGRVVEVVYFGQSVRVHARTDSGVAVVAVSDAAQALPTAGQSVRLDWAPQDTWVMAA